MIRDGLCGHEWCSPRALVNCVIVQLVDADRSWIDARQRRIDARVPHQQCQPVDTFYCSFDSLEFPASTGICHDSLWASSDNMT
jgi:hypothetical protein